MAQPSHNILGQYNNLLSWALMYNLYADKLLQLNFIPDSVSHVHSSIPSFHLIQCFTGLRNTDVVLCEPTRWALVFIAISLSIVQILVINDSFNLWDAVWFIGSPDEDRWAWYVYASIMVLKGGIWPPSPNSQIGWCLLRLQSMKISHATTSCHPYMPMRLPIKQIHLSSLNIILSVGQILLG